MGCLGFEGSGFRVKRDLGLLGFYYQDHESSEDGHDQDDGDYVILATIAASVVRVATRGIFIYFFWLCYAVISASSTVIPVLLF